MPSTSHRFRGLIGETLGYLRRRRLVASPSSTKTLRTLRMECTNAQFLYELERDRIRRAGKVVDLRHRVNLDGLHKSLLRAEINLGLATRAHEVTSAKPPSTAPALRVARNVIGIASAILPARIADEELGDAMEDIERRIAVGRPMSEIRLKIWASVGWAVFHSATYAVRRTGRAFSAFRRKGS